MNPDKLFDYLDGSLDPADRAEVERRLAAEPAVQRELAIAREIHKGMRGGGSREIIGTSADATERGGRLGRRVAIAFAALVLLNVFVGIAFIIGKSTKRGEDIAVKDRAIRQQLTSSLQNTAETFLPAPHVANEIILHASASERDALADKVVTAATSAGGSAAKALPDEKTTAIIADLPTAREQDFRHALVALGAVDSSPRNSEARSGAERTLMEVRIVDTPRDK